MRDAAAIDRVGPGATPARVPDRWAAIWQAGTPLIAPPRMPDALPRQDMSLCLEFVRPPSPRGRPLRLWQGAAEPGRAFALYAMPDLSLRLVHGEIDMSTPAGFAREGETVSLRYRSCARGRGDIVDFVNHDADIRHRRRAGLGHAARLDEMLPRDAGFLRVCHIAAIAEFGLSPTDVPGLSAGTLLPTTAGPMPVERLQPGIDLVTVTGEAMTLRWVDRRPRLCLGRQAPMLLRAPYFGLEHDIRVTPETRVMRDGPAVEYTFGVERVLVRAADLALSPGAFRDRRLAVRQMHHLMLDDHACIAVDRCGVESALLRDVIAAEDSGGARSLSDTDRTPCLPVVDRAGAQALVVASARGRKALS